MPHLALYSLYLTIISIIPIYKVLMINKYSVIISLYIRFNGVDSYGQ